jgi:hypothetical protein
MEYFIGSVVTIFTVLVFGKLFSKGVKPAKSVSIGYSQAYIHEIVKDSLPYSGTMSKSLVTQATNFNKELYHKVVVAENVAYWISNNQFFCAPMEGGTIKKDFAKVVDTITMDSVELKKMTFIVQTLTEGDDAK